MIWLNHIGLNKLLHGVGWKEEQADKFHVAKSTCRYEAANPILRPTRMPRDLSDGHQFQTIWRKC